MKCAQKNFNSPSLVESMLAMLKMPKPRVAKESFAARYLFSPTAFRGMRVTKEMQNTDEERQKDAASSAV